MNHSDTAFVDETTMSVHTPYIVHRTRAQATESVDLFSNYVITAIIGADDDKELHDRGIDRAYLHVRPLVADWGWDIVIPIPANEVHHYHVHDTFSLTHIDATKT